MCLYVDVYEYVEVQCLLSPEEGVGSQALQLDSYECYNVGTENSVPLK